MRRQDDERWRRFQRTVALARTRNVGVAQERINVAVGEALREVRAARRRIVTDGMRGHR